jgi:hypothetical protein
VNRAHDFDWQQSLHQRQPPKSPAMLFLIVWQRLEAVGHRIDNE